VGNCDDQLACEEEAIRLLPGSGKAPSGMEGWMDGMGARGRGALEARGALFLGDGRGLT